MKNLFFVSACLLLVTNLSYANLAKRHIYNKNINTQSTNWHITFVGDSNNWVNTWNNPSSPHMCTNIDSTPITDTPGCQVATNSDILQQGCGLSEGGICISYQSDDLDALAGKVYITDPCGKSSTFQYWTGIIDDVAIDNISGDKEAKGGINLNDPTPGDITIYSDVCI